MKEYNASKALKELELLEDWEQSELVEYLENPSSILMEMANVRGNDLHKSFNYRLPFSFYFCNKEVVHGVHGIRVKIIWNPSKAPANADGYMELHGNYDYISGSKKYKPTADELSIARNFFRKYKVLFSAVWEGILYDNDLIDFFRGRIDLNELLSKIREDDDTLYYDINHCETVEELEAYVRKSKAFNMND